MDIRGIKLSTRATEMDPDVRFGLRNSHEEALALLRDNLTGPLLPVPEGVPSSPTSAEWERLASRVVAWSSSSSSSAGNRSAVVDVSEGSTGSFGTGTGWLILYRTGFRPVSDQFQTSLFRPVYSDQCHRIVVGSAQSMSQSLLSPIHSPCHRVMSDAPCHVGFLALVLTEIHERNLKEVVQCWWGNWSVDV